MTICHSSNQKDSNVAWLLVYRRGVLKIETPGETDLHHSFIYLFIPLGCTEYFPHAGTRLRAGETQWAGQSSFHVTNVCPTLSTYKALCKELCKSWFLTSKDHSLTRKKINPYWQYQYTWSHHLAGSTFTTPVSNKVLHSTRPGGSKVWGGNETFITVRSLWD